MLDIPAPAESFIHTLGGRLIVSDVRIHRAMLDYILGGIIMSKQIFVYVGTFTRSGSEGIYVYRMDTSSGALTLASVARGVEDPAYLAIAPGGDRLYAVNHVTEFAGQASGAVSAFSIDPDTGELVFLNQQPSHGTDPCHLCVDKTGRWVLVANSTMLTFKAGRAAGAGLSGGYSSSGSD